jgi:ATP-dependent DNA helicase RecG
MKKDRLENTLRYLMELPIENEWVEFKEAKNNFDFNELGKYFSSINGAR